MIENFHPAKELVWEESPLLRRWKRTTVAVGAQLVDFADGAVENNYRASSPLLRIIHLVLVVNDDEVSRNHPR